MGIGKSVASGRLAVSDFYLCLFLRAIMFLIPRSDGDPALYYLV